jgi:hypothetical protein
VTRRLPIAVVLASIAAFPWARVAMVSVVLVIVGGIFLPAVWSREPARRRDARLLAERILRLFERRR